jgi:hypothetical protein
MPQDLDLFFRTLEKVSSLFGPALGALVLVVAVAICLLLYFFQRRLASIAEEISDKSVAAFGRKLDVAFRDEYLRNNLRFELGKLSYRKKLEMFESTYRLYFEYQNCWSWTTNTFKEQRNNLWQKFLQAREKLILSSIFLSPEFHNHLLSAIANMLTNLQTMTLTTTGVTTDTKREREITQSLDDAAKWLVDNLVTHQDVTMYEFTEEQLKLLAEQRAKVFKSEI